MRVSNLTSPRSDKPVANQFVIQDYDKEWFQSYSTMIAKREDNIYTISGDYNYSVTTSKYFNQWLRDCGWQEPQIVELRKWLKKADYGQEVAILGYQGIEVKYVEAL